MAFPMKETKGDILAFRLSPSWKKRAELLASLGGHSLSNLAHAALCEKIVIEEEKLAHWETTGKLRVRIDKLRGERAEWDLVRSGLWHRIEDAEVLKEIVKRRDTETETERKRWWIEEEKRKKQSEKK